MTDIPGENLLSHLPNLLAFISQVFASNKLATTILTIMIQSSNRARPKELYWFTATTVAPVQPPSLLLFSWQRYNLNDQEKMLITINICSIESPWRPPWQWFALSAPPFNPTQDSWHSLGRNLTKSRFSHLATIFRLWEAMKFRLSPNCLRYKLYRLHMVSCQSILRKKYQKYQIKYKKIIKDRI